jgi:benzylsuccinate CoA-transferase BbsF subunit
MDAQIFDGIRMIEFGWAVVGPLTTSWAGGYGAQVIKVETKTRPDIIRSMTPFKEDRVNLDNSLFFGRENAGKLSISLNLKHPKAVQLAKDLVSLSDVVLDSYTAGVMARYGLGYEDLKRIKPDIIMLSSCMYGQTGRLRSMPGYGVPLTAISGLTYLCGWPDRQPTGPYGSYTDYLVPRFNLLAIAAALDYRRRTGEGIYLDAAQLESSVQFVAPILLDYQANGHIGRRAANRDDRGAPHGVYPCRGKEQWIAISVMTEEQWKGFCRALGQPSWTASPEFAEFGARKKNEEKLDQRVAAWTSDRVAREAMEILQVEGVPAGVANSGRDLGEDPQLRHDRYFTRLSHPEMGEVDYAPHSVTFSRSPQRINRSPCLGEHTEQICKEILGLSEEAFDQLKGGGVFE